MGYVWCDGYVWDMSGVRYANNLLKNPATKRLSGKTPCPAFFKAHCFPHLHNISQELLSFTAFQYWTEESLQMLQCLSQPRWAHTLIQGKKNESPFCLDKFDPEKQSIMGTYEHTIESR